MQMGASAWDTRDLVVVGLGGALIVFFAGVTASVAAGQTPPTALWAAGSAVSGALIGLLVPSPGEKKRYEAAAAAAEIVATRASNEVTAHLATARATTTAEGVASNAKVEAAKAEADTAKVAAAAAKATAVATPETKPATMLLLGFFVVSLSLGLVLAAGAIVPPQAFTESFKSVITAVIALASASGSALVGILAPTPSKG